MQIASLEASRETDVLHSLKNFRDVKSQKQIMVALKETLKDLSNSFKRHNCDDVSVYIAITIELLFIPESSFMHNCYLNFVKSQPEEVKNQVLGGWMDRVQGLENPIRTMEIIHSISSMGSFESIESDICIVALDVTSQVLRKSLNSETYIGEETEVMLEKVSKMGYAIISKCSKDICSNTKGHELLDSCLSMTITVLKVGYMLASRYQYTSHSHIATCR